MAKARNYKGGFNGTPFHSCEGIEDKACIVCERPFPPKSGVHKFCSDSCRGRWKYITGSGSTEKQYEKISGNWGRYLQRLKVVGGVKRESLTVEIMLKVLERQDYLCALSGMPLTCQLQKGVRTFTNASIDRIVAGGDYLEHNIQFVCRGLNSWRSDTPLEEFIEVCRKVAETHPREEER